MNTVKKQNVEFVKVPSTYLKAKHLERMFDITPTTLYNWRKTLNLPFHKMVIEGKKNTPVYYKLEEVLMWANRNHIKIKNWNYKKIENTV